MATERVKLLRRPRRVLVTGGFVRRGRPARVVKSGTRGMYDPDPSIATETARAMVQSRETVAVRCSVEGCEKVFESRLVDGEPERRACGSSHRLRLWRAEMRAKGYVQRTVDGVLGWMTPEGRFYANPSQPKKRVWAGKVRRVRGARAREADNSL